jgi:hypothetical protein
MSRSCPTCRTPLTPKSRFCPACGAATPLEATVDTATMQSTQVSRGSAGAAGPVPAIPTQDTSATPVSVPPPSPVPANPAPSPISVPKAPPAIATDLKDPEVAIPVPKPTRLTRAPFGEESCPFALELNLPHALVGGHAGTMVFRAENESPTAIENLELYVSSRGLAGEALSRVRRLNAGGRTEILLEVEAERAGHFVIQIAAAWDQGGQRFSYRGQHPLRIYKAPDNSNIVINIQDIQSNTGGGANQALGAEYGDVQISNLIAKGAIKSVNDLLDLDLPENFQRIALELDYEVSRQDSGFRAAHHSASLQIPAGLLSTVQPAKLCSFEAQGAAAPALPFRLVARPQFRLGRARADADFISWILPRNASNDEKTMRVSKVQAIAEATTEGILIRDNASANGTLFDGVPLDENGTSLPRQGRLLLAGAVEIDFDRVPPGVENDPVIGNARQWAGPPATAPLQRGALRFEIYPPEDQPLNAIWLLSDGTFGTSRSNAIAMAADATLAEVQGRFHHYRGCFWVETLVANNAVQVDQLSLRPGEIAPLATGQQLRIGARTWRVKLEN